METTKHLDQRSIVRFMLNSLLLFTTVILISGCTVESGPKSLNQVSEETEVTQAYPNAKDVLEKAIKYTQNTSTLEGHEKVENFWFAGYIRNDIGKRTTTSMYNGAVVNPHGYIVNARLTAEPFQYYRWDDKVFIKDGDSWYRANKDPLPFNLTKGFDGWFPFVEQAVQLKDEEILSVPCSVMQITLTGKEWANESNIHLFSEIKEKIQTDQNMESLLEQTSVTLKVWVGKEDERIHQYQTLIEMPMPGAGYMKQEAFFRLYKFNDPGIKMKSPEEIEQYVENNQL